MNLRIAAVALLAPLLAISLIAPRPLSIALGGPFAEVRSTIAAYAIVTPSARPAPIVLPPEQTSDDDGEIGVTDQRAPNFAGPGPGWG